MKKLLMLLFFLFFTTAYCPVQKGRFIENCKTIEIAGNGQRLSLIDVIVYANAKLENLRLHLLNDFEKKHIKSAIKAGRRYSVYRERKKDQLPLEIIFGHGKYLYSEDE